MKDEAGLPILNRGQARILVVNGDRTFCFVCKEILREAGYRPALSFDAGEAWERLGREHFDLVLWDLDLPGMPGGRPDRLGTAVAPLRRTPSGHFPLGSRAGGRENALRQSAGGLSEQADRLPHPSGEDPGGAGGPSRAFRGKEGLTSMFRVFRHYIPVRVVTLLAGDLAIFVWAAYAGVWLRFWADPMAMAAIGPIFPKALFFASVNISIAFLLGLYAAEGNPDTRDTTARVVVTGLAGAVANSALFYLIPNLSLGRGMFVLAMLAGAVVFLNWRLFFLWMMRQPGLNSRILVVGAGPAAGDRRRHPEQRIQPGVPGRRVRRGERRGPRAVQTNRVFQHSENSLYRLALKERVNKIVVALGERRGAFPLKEILTCKMMGIEVLDLPTFYEQVSGRILLKDLRPSWLIFSDGFRKNATALAAKRMVDILLACVGLILALPFFRSRPWPSKSIRAGPSCSGRPGSASTDDSSRSTSSGRCARTRRPRQGRSGPPRVIPA